MCGGESALSVGEHQLAGIRQTGLAQGLAYFATTVLDIRIPGLQTYLSGSWALRLSSVAQELQHWPSQLGLSHTTSIPGLQEYL